MRSEARIIQRLDKRYPQKGDMDLGNPKDTLLGVLLSARTKDSQVLKLFPAFKKRFPTFKSLAEASPKEIEPYLSTIGLYRAKAKAIHGLAKMILDRYHGEVPSTMDELRSLPGVGRKTANCVLAYVFGKQTVCVDTHVFRISHRLGWSKGKTPEVVERDLQRLIPEATWNVINRTFVRFGREICVPGKPKCAQCPLKEMCPTGKPRTKSQESRVKDED